MVKKTAKKHSKQVNKVEDLSHLIEPRDIAYDFAIKAYKNFKEIIKSIVLFGSVPKKEVSINSDVDIVILIDDTSIRWDDELIAWYREELSKLVGSLKYNRQVHINTVTISTFWEDIRAGDALTINVLRYGEALIDYGGFFEPLKGLLAKGKIRSTPEAIFTAMERSSTRLIQASNNLLISVESLYWAMVDSSQAALMAVHAIPPSPEFIADLLNDIFVKQKLLDKKYVDWFEDVRKISKSITYGEIKYISGTKLEELHTKANKFVESLTALTKAIIKDEKIVRIEYK